MKFNLKTWSAAPLAALSIGACCLPGRAQAYQEVGDAGNTLATAQGTATAGAPAGTTLSSITGTIGTGMDADLYVVRINSPTTFSATTNNAVTKASFNGLALDTALFLFNAAGVEVATNDDTSGTNVTSTLGTGNPLYASLGAGTYYLGISISGNEPVNSANQLLFALSDDSSSVRGAEAANNLNPTTLSTFDLDNYDNETGTYEIDLNGVTAAVPEPSTWALTALGGCAAWFIARRRRASRV